MSYLKKPSLLRQQQELRKLIDERLDSEESKVKERIYQWLNNNQYFTDNELFDFYFSVAQNIAAVEVMGASGEKIVKAKNELEQSAEAYTAQILDTSNWISEQLNGQLENIQKNQQNLNIKLDETLSDFAKAQHNLQTISNGLVNSTSISLKKQKQLVIYAEEANKYARLTIVIAWVIPATLTLIYLGVSLYK